MTSMDSSPPPLTHPLYTRIRLATESDVPSIHKMILQMAVFERLTHLVQVTQQSLTTTLSKSTPFSSITIFLIEVSSSTPFPLHHQPTLSHFTPIHNTLHLSTPIYDPEADLFGSGSGPDSVIAGFVLFFPNFSTFMGKQGFYVDFLFVREVYRSKGFGKMLMKAVANQALRFGYGRMDWTVLDWNENAIRLYERIGAEVTKEWRLCRLTGDALQCYGQPN